MVEISEQISQQVKSHTTLLQVVTWVVYRKFYKDRIFVLTVAASRRPPPRSRDRYMDRDRDRDRYDRRSPSNLHEFTQFH